MVESEAPTTRIITTTTANQEASSDVFTLGESAKGPSTGVVASQSLFMRVDQIDYAGNAQT